MNRTKCFMIRVVVVVVVVVSSSCPFECTWYFAVCFSRSGFMIYNVQVLLTFAVETCSLDNLLLSELSCRDAFMLSGSEASALTTGH